ncbi:hypothetical protein GCM10010330_67800 [Streptomyces tendae]|nr:hypothetical protein [Streptomyces tendae]GHB03913.1 hypothetical protein GCM10010330_67800 [Streptomyces tendae]
MEPLDEAADGGIAAFAAVGLDADNATAIVINRSPDHQPPLPEAHRA